jgi:hypothetical protein
MLPTDVFYVFANANIDLLCVQIYWRTPKACFNVERTKHGKDLILKYRAKEVSLLQFFDEICHELVHFRLNSVEVKCSSCKF